MSAPDPLVPADLDLRDFRWMKLDLVALFNSAFNLTLDDTAWRCGVTLWGKSWHQVPAGSLPDDDAMLCSLAGLGRDLKTWKRVRSTALHGFVKCNDGKLYHPFVCDMALEAQAERDKYESRKASDRSRKKGKGKPESALPSDGTPQETGEPSAGNPQENRFRGTGTGTETEEDPVGSARAPTRAREPDPGVEVIRAFDCAIIETFGDPRPWPHSTDHVWAKRYLEAGADMALLEPLFRSVCQRFKAEGGSRPDSLKVVEKWVTSAIAARDRPATEPANGGTRKPAKPTIAERVGNVAEEILGDARGLEPGFAIAGGFDP